MDEHAPGLPIPLDPAVFSNDNEAMTCDCDGICCFEHAILLTHHDVQRIIDGVPGLDLRELLVFFVAKEGYTDAEALGAYPFIFLDGEPCYMGLRFVVDASEPRRHCRFLDHATNTCSIHAFKPMICRTYPFIIDRGMITRHEKIRCKRAYHPRDACQIASLQRTLNDAYREFEDYNQKAGSWNKNTRDAASDELFHTFFKL
ncbi:MAG: YkgJ family cysteine cluster protein [Candidatus Lokiarchaeota archaeon]|nr:YkgJ family cysteine cluster protein [Candidatus Lokiarchaeota archaeon]